jgi:hypothetical protein
MAYRIIVTPQMQNVNLVGHFSASGGSGNDIRVLLMSQDNYQNWQNGHGGRANYDSQKVTAGNINVRLSTPDTYYLVFDNGFSLFSDKVVNVEANLHYEQ